MLKNNPVDSMITKFIDLLEDEKDEFLYYVLHSFVDRRPVKEVLESVKEMRELLDKISKEVDKIASIYNSQEQKSGWDIHADSLLKEKESSWRSLSDM